MQPVNQEQIRRASGETLRLLRKRIGLAQERVALEARVERSHMGSLERGKFAPNFETLFKLLPILQVSFQEYAAVFESTLRVIRKHEKAKAKRKLPPSQG